ncbi:MAG: DUF1127 domain-containing protein [Alphaproteobacteria bacterium]|nr:DUF1127 domain-containing protein [Alphaproteobacteria bacterium]
MTDTNARAARLTATQPIGVATAKRAGLFARLLHAWEVRRALRDVQSMDDRMLRDIGLSRGDVESAVRGDW